GGPKVNSLDVGVGLFQVGFEVDVPALEVVAVYLGKELGAKVRAPASLVLGEDPGVEPVLRRDLREKLDRYMRVELFVLLGQDVEVAGRIPAVGLGPLPRRIVSGVHPDDDLLILGEGKRAARQPNGNQ